MIQRLFLPILLMFLVSHSLGEIDYSIASAGSQKDISNGDIAVENPSFPQNLTIRISYPDFSFDDNLFSLFEAYRNELITQFKAFNWIKIEFNQIDDSSKVPWVVIDDDREYEMKLVGSDSEPIAVWRLLCKYILRRRIPQVEEEAALFEEKSQALAAYNNKVMPWLERWGKVIEELGRLYHGDFSSKQIAENLKDLADFYEELASKYTQLITNDARATMGYLRIPSTWAEYTIEAEERQYLEAAISCWEKAKSCLEKAEKVSESNSQSKQHSPSGKYYRLLGNAYFDLRNYQQAVAHFDQAPQESLMDEMNLFIAQFMAKLITKPRSFEHLPGWFNDEIPKMPDKPINQLFAEFISCLVDSPDVNRLDEQLPDKEIPQYLYSIGLEFQKRDMHELAVRTFNFACDSYKRQPGGDFIPGMQKLKLYLTANPEIHISPAPTRLYIGDRITFTATAETSKMSGHPIAIAQVKEWMQERWKVSWNIKGGKRDDLKELGASRVEFTPTSEGSVIITAYDGLNKGGPIKVRVYDRAGVIVFTDEKLERKDKDGKVEVSYVTFVQEKLKGDLLDRKYKVKYLLPEDMQRLRQLLAEPRNQKIDAASLLRSDELSQERMNIAQLSHLFVVGRVTVKIEEVSEDDERFRGWKKAVADVAFDAFDTTSFTLIAHEAANGRGIYSLEEVAIKYSLDEVYNKISLNFFEQLDKYRKSEERIR